MGAAAYDAWAAFGNFMANAMMRRAEAKDDDERYAARAELAEKAMEAREIAREERAAKRATGRSDVYRGVGVGPDGPSQDVALVDLTNAAGDVVSRRDASPREVSEYDTRQQALADQARFDQEEFNRKQEDRLLDRKVKETGMTNQSRRAAAQEERASRTGLTQDKTEKPLSRNEALKALSSFRYRADEGENARSVAKRDGLSDEDYDDLVRIAGSGKPKEPGAFERGVNAVGRGLSSLAERFTPKESTGRSVMAERKPGEKKADKKAEPKKDDGSYGVIKAGYVDEEEGMRFLGGNPNDPKNWEPIK